MLLTHKLRQQHVLNVKQVIFNNILRSYYKFYKEIVNTLSGGNRFSNALEQASYLI